MAASRGIVLPPLGGGIPLPFFPSRPRRSCPPQRKRAPRCRGVLFYKKGHQAALRGNTEVALDVREDAVTERASLLDVPGLEGTSARWADVRRPACRTPPAGYPRDARGWVDSTRASGGASGICFSLLLPPQRKRAPRSRGVLFYKKGHQAALRGNTEVALNVREDAVTERASLLDVPGLEGEAETFCRSIRFMDSDVAPPHTSVIPKVVIEVIVIDTKRDFCLL